MRGAPRSVQQHRTGAVHTNVWNSNRGRGLQGLLDSTEGSWEFGRMDRFTQGDLVALLDEASVTKGVVARRYDGHAHGRASLRRSRQVDPSRPYRDDGPSGS